MSISTECINDEIDRATRLGQELEDLVAGKGGFVIRSDRDDLIIGYWSLIFEYGKGILALVRLNFPAPAFALLRPVVDALVKAHMALIGSERDVLSIRQDRYNVSYEKDGRRIDEAFGLGSLLDNYLKQARPLLHSLTHSGRAQLWRRFEGEQVGASFSDVEVAKLVGNTSAAVYLITVLVTRHFGFEEERQAAERVFLQYGTRT
jgi:hypothetical protein